MAGPVQKSSCRRGGFVTLDLIWIIALFAFAIVLSVRGIDLVDKRANAGRLERELRVVGAAVEKLAEEGGIEPGTEVGFDDYAPFLDKGAPKRLREKGEDPLGGNYGSQVVGAEPVPDAATVKTLGKFWK